jgi:hypothetical protein
MVYSQPSLRDCLKAEADRSVGCVDGETVLGGDSPTAHSLWPKVKLQVRSGPTAGRGRRDDKIKGGGPPWHGWRWMDRVEKKLIWTSLFRNSLRNVRDQTKGDGFL